MITSSRLNNMPVKTKEDIIKPSSNAVVLTQKKARKLRAEIVSASKILSFLYLSGRKPLTMSKGKWLDEVNITHVVSLLRRKLKLPHVASGQHLVLA